MLTIHPYLNFDGNCREAMNFYAQLFGGQLDLQTFGASPMADQVGPDEKDAIMHGRLTAPNLLLQGSDAIQGRYEKPQGFQITIDVDDAPWAERVFSALTDGGSVVMPIQETFWAERFGMCVDKFGTPWMINCSRAMAGTGATS